MKARFAFIFCVGMFLGLESLPLESIFNSPTNRPDLVNRFLQFGNFVKSVAKHAVTTAADIVQEGIETRKVQISCHTCSIGANLLVSYVRSGRSKEAIVRTATTICITFNIESEIVCKGAVNAFVDDVVYIIKNSPNLTEKDICGFVMGTECEKPEFETKFNWTVELPSTTKPQVELIHVPDEGLPTLNILHLSDTHLDPHYQEGSLANCGLPVCCRSSINKTAAPHERAGKWGDHRNCDAPEILVDNMLVNIAKNHKIDLIFWTGDLPPHDIYNQSKTENINTIKILAELLLKHFPYTPIFPALGNHEGHPVNSFPQPEIQGEFSIDWLYHELSKSWSKLIQKDVSRTVNKGAYYSVSAGFGLRIISLNTNYCNNKNWWLLMDNKDPAQELKWLIEELQKAESAGEKVYLLGHIPPGSSDCNKIWSRNFHKIVNRYESTIAAQFYGHTHFDEIMIFYDEKETRPMSVAYVGPSTTPYDHVNPAYKIYVADGDRANSTRMVLDGETYYMNLTESNEIGTPIWRKLFSYKESYKMKSLTPEDWHGLMDKIVKDDSFFDIYFSNMHRSSLNRAECDSKCLRDHLCRQVTAKSFDHSMCEVLGILPPGEAIATAGLLEK